MKRHVFAVLAVLLGSSIIAGCEKYQGNDIEEDEKVHSDKEEIVYYTWKDEKLYAEKVAEAFCSQYPNIEVRVKYLQDNFTLKEISEIIDTEHVDVIGAKSINGILELVDQDKVISITDSIISSGIDTSCYGNMYNGVSVDREYYCLPTRKTNWMLVYNKDIFEREGLPYPEQMTWDEYAALARRLTRDGDEGKQWGGYFVDWVYNFMGIQKGDYLHDDDISSLKESLEFLNKLYNVDKSHMTIEEMEMENWLAAFESGAIAMMPQGEWFVGMILSDEASGLSTVDWDLAPMPVSEDVQQGNTWGQYQLAAITSSCTDKEAAFLFLEFLCGEEGAKIYASNGIIPAYMNDDIQSIYSKIIGDHNAKVLFESYQIQEVPVYNWYPQLQSILEEEAKEYLCGRQTIDEAMDNFLDRRENFFEGMKK